MSSADEAFLARVREVLEEHHADEEFSVAEVARAVGQDRSPVPAAAALAGQSPEAVRRDWV